MAATTLFLTLESTYLFGPFTRLAVGLIINSDYKI